MFRRLRDLVLVLGLALGLTVTLVGPSASAAPPTPTRAAAPDPFYAWTDDAALEAAAPGDVLRTRTVPFHVVGIRTPVQVVQILYRTTDVLGQPVANTTSVVLPSRHNGQRAVAYQSFYDSLDPADSPSRIFAGDVTFGGLVANTETAFLAPLLLLGYPVIVADTQGPDANFAAGPEYGYATLDSIRAAQTTTATGLTTNTKVGMLGYSGGAIATSWAAALGPEYAPDVNEDIVGAASGGLLVNPARNLKYVEGTPAWAGIAGMALVGLTRAYEFDLSPYLSARGHQVLARLDDASILNAYLQYPGLTFAQLMKPEYSDPTLIPGLSDILNDINLGERPSPTVPLFLAQATLGIVEGTPSNRPGIGAGDGVMIAGDVRTLARQYCGDGLAVRHTEYGLLSHIPGALPWAPQAISWLGDRFNNRPAPSNCSSIRPGNPLDPISGAPAAG